MRTDSGRSPDGSGYSAEPEPSCTVSAVPVSIPNADERETYCEAFFAMLRCAVSAAYAKQVRRGFTAEVMAKRIGYSVEEVRRLLLVPRDLKIDQLSDLCIAMRCEPELANGPNGQLFIGVYPHPEDWPDALATGTQSAETNQDLAQSERTGA